MELLIWEGMSEKIDSNGKKFSKIVSSVIFPTRKKLGETSITAKKKRSKES